MSDRAEFLAERASMIGGSDAADLLTLHPFGCKRRLWYDKKGVPADFEFPDASFHIQRGTHLEAIAIKVFCEQNVATLEFGEVRKQTLYRLKEFPFIGAHVDQVVEMPLGRTVLEMKCPSSRNFNKIKHDGCPNSWLVQCQWGMMAADVDHGVVGVFNPDLWKTLAFPVEKDEAFQANLRAVAAGFWQSLSERENPVAKLSTLAGDPAAECHRCRWRTKCQGLGQNIVSLTEEERIDLAARKWLRDDSPSLLALVDQFEEAGRERSEAEKFYKELKAELEDWIHGDSLIIADGRRLITKMTLAQIKAKEAYVQKRVSIAVLPPE